MDTLDETAVIIVESRKVSIENMEFDIYFDSDV